MNRLLVILFRPFNALHYLPGFLEKSLPTRFISRNQKRVNQTVDLGYIKISEHLEAIREFLTADKSETAACIAGERESISLSTCRP